MLPRYPAYLGSFRFRLICMKITIFAAGSRGDIQPCVALSRGMQQAGYQVRLAAPANFADFIQQHEVEFFSLRGDIQQIMAGDTGREFMESGGANPLKSIRAVRKMIAPVIMSMAADVYASCQGADALICLGIFSAFGQSIAAALNIPILHVEPVPLLPTRAFPAPSWPIQQDLGGLHNYLSGQAMLQTIWQWYRPFVNAFRQTLGLTPYSAVRFHDALRSTPTLSAYSAGIIPRPADWPESHFLTGAFFLDPRDDWQPSPELTAFLAGGEPPVYIGFGSMAGREPQRLTRLTLEALALSGRRGVLVTGWGGLRPELIPNNVFVLDSAPHAWLFPRMAAVVHHGGAGTTAEGLRAGVPTVIVPFAFDQAFWGARIKALGLGPEPLPQNKLTAVRLAAAIRTAVSDPMMQQRARAVGVALRAEDGVNNAVQIIRKTLGEPRAMAREVLR